MLAHSIINLGPYPDLNECHAHYICFILQTRAVKPELYQFWMAGAKKFYMVEPESEFWIPVPQTQFVGKTSCTNNKMFFSFQWTIILESELENSRCWSSSQKM